MRLGAQNNFEPLLLTVCRSRAVLSQLTGPTTHVPSFPNDNRDKQSFEGKKIIKRLSSTGLAPVIEIFTSEKLEERAMMPG